MNGPTFSLVMPYYENPAMLGMHLAQWSRWPHVAKDAIEVVLVDDGSPVAPAAPIVRAAMAAALLRLPRVRVYRHTVDKPWHQHAARNTGAHEADGAWLLLTDMDHVLTPPNAEALVRNFSRDCIVARAYMPRRLEPDGTLTRNAAGQTKPHPNTFLMPRSYFWTVGGYDERLCGVYGTDSDFRNRINFTTTSVFDMVRYNRTIVPDASTNGLQRKENTNRGRQRAAALAARERDGGRRLSLTMAYTKEIQ